MVYFEQLLLSLNIRGAKTESLYFYKTSWTGTDCGGGGRRSNTHKKKKKKGNTDQEKAQRKRSSKGGDFYSCWSPGHKPGFTTSLWGARS